VVELFTVKGLYRMTGSRFWWFRWTQRGRRYAVSLKTDDESIAITKARAILVEEIFIPGVQPTLDESITQYLRVAQERAKKPLRPEVAKTRGYILRKYAVDMQVKMVGQINHNSVSEWLRSRAGVSRDTIHTYARTIKTFVRYLEDLKLVRPGLYQELEVP